jgi:hypothetical protein
VKRFLQTVQQCEVCPIYGRISNLESPSGPMQVQYVDVAVNSVQNGEEHVVNNLLASDNFVGEFMKLMGTPMKIANVFCCVLIAICQIKMEIIVSLQGKERCQFIFYKCHEFLSKVPF